MAFLPPSELVVVDPVADTTTGLELTFVFADGFETGDTSAWSVVVP